MIGRLGPLGCSAGPFANMALPCVAQLPSEAAKRTVMEHVLTGDVLTVRILGRYTDLEILLEELASFAVSI